MKGTIHNNPVRGLWENRPFKNFKLLSKAEAEGVLSALRGELINDAMTLSGKRYLQHTLSVIDADAKQLAKLLGQGAWKLATFYISLMDMFGVAPAAVNWGTQIAELVVSKGEGIETFAAGATWRCEADRR